uniref:Potassium channel toxin alpha-KTx 26.1 n=1 Tax=Olivierus martensii TaxID=34649 RepID=KA261_OLIMR|nr:RecName: Full=Potassium channel toxin alpha-KTx 26.1; AltName: Full=Neurotoxin BmK86; Flags: Precursor [Mesobuthus martensii]ABR14604.1 potassium channel blocker [Mesobuthus martensii]
MSRLFVFILIALFLSAIIDVMSNFKVEGACSKPCRKYCIDKGARNGKCINGRCHCYY